MVRMMGRDLDDVSVVTVTQGDKVLYRCKVKGLTLSEDLDRQPAARRSFCGRSALEDRVELAQLNAALRMLCRRLLEIKGGV
jgi:hypothetical protein